MKRPKKTYRDEWEAKGHRLLDPSDWKCGYCSMRFGANQLLEDQAFNIPWCTNTFQGKIEAAVLRDAVQKGLREMKVDHKYPFNDYPNAKNLFTNSRKSHGQ